jgi:hypothetical protein
LHFVDILLNEHFSFMDQASEGANQRAKCATIKSQLRGLTYVREVALPALNLSLGIIMLILVEGWMMCLLIRYKMIALVIT